LFIDDMPLAQVLTKEDVGAGRFYFDHASGRIYFADDPTGRKVEATVAVFAFESVASNVPIRDVIIEKYAGVAQKRCDQSPRCLGMGRVPRKRHGAERKARSLLIAGPAEAPQTSNRLGSHGVGTPESIVGRG
jgi:hypothetical protein